MPISSLRILPISTKTVTVARQSSAGQALEPCASLFAVLQSEPHKVRFSFGSFISFNHLSMISHLPRQVTWSFQDRAQETPGIRLADAFSLPKPEVESTHHLTHARCRTEKLA